MDDRQQSLMSKSKHELWQETLRGLYDKASAKHKRLIQAAAQDGIEWRGEDYQHFLRVIAEVDIASQLSPEDYRYEAVRWLKTLRIGAALPYDKARHA